MKPVTVRVVHPEEALQALMGSLRVPLGIPNIESLIIAATLRRLCGFMCPCPATALARAARDSLLPFHADEAALVSDIETTIEELLVAGDIIELSNVLIAGAEDKEAWLYCAPPSFSVRAQRAYFFGIAPDGAEILPDEFKQEVCREGVLRFLEIRDESLEETLRSIGLREIGADAWLTSVRTCSAEQYLERSKLLLEQHGADGDFPEFTLLRHADGQTRGYRDRWRAPTDDSGLFIIRAAQAFGAPNWYFAHLVQGRVRRSLLLPPVDVPERACDVAWRIQLAIDATQHHAARVRVETVGDESHVTLGFPPPLALRRRLTVLDGKRREGGELWRYAIATSQLNHELNHLQSCYWYQPQYPERGGAS